MTQVEQHFQCAIEDTSFCSQCTQLQILVDGCEVRHIKRSKVCMGRMREGGVAAPSLQLQHLIVQ